MTDWQPTGVGPPLDELVVDDFSLVDEISHPVRGPIFRRLKTPRSAAELAELMNVPVTRLYHHLNHLERVGMIRVVATRRVGAATERRYQVVARSLRADEDLYERLDQRDLVKAAGSLFDVAKLGIQRTIEARTSAGLRTDEHSIVSLGESTVDPERLDAFLEKLTALIDEFRTLESDDAAASADGTNRFTLFVACYPVVD